MNKTAATSLICFSLTQWQCIKYVQVVSALEQLERLAMKNEREDASLSELRSRVALLETDKREKAQERAKFEKVRSKSLFQH